jgi:hypothetical protein
MDSIICPHIFGRAVIKSSQLVFPINYLMNGVMSSSTKAVRALASIALSCANTLKLKTEHINTKAITNLLQ